MPTGVPLHDVRAQLFDAAERVLLRAGPNELTSRAVTTEAGVAKGVMHRHFADFDAFLAEFALDRIGRIDDESATLRASAGTGTVAGNLTGALTGLFGSVALPLVGLIISRDSLRARLRAARQSRFPLMAEAEAMIASYLTAERDLGRLAADADIGTLAPMLLGTGHLLFAGRDGTQPDPGEVSGVVTAAIAGALPRPGLSPSAAQRATGSGRPRKPGICHPLGASSRRPVACVASVVIVTEIRDPTER